MPWTYILECADGSYYVGSTTDLDRRISQHNEGLGAAYTRHRRPVRLVWSAYFSRIDQAYAFEKRVQGWGRAKRKALIDDNTGDLSHLSGRSWESRNKPPPSVREATRAAAHNEKQVAPDDPRAPGKTETVGRGGRASDRHETNEADPLCSDDPWAPPPDAHRAESATQE